MNAGVKTEAKEEFKNNPDIEEKTAGGLSVLGEVVVNAAKEKIEPLDPCVKDYVTGHIEQRAVELAAEAIALKTGNPAIIGVVSTIITVNEILTAGDDVLNCLGSTVEHKENSHE